MRTAQKQGAPVKIVEAVVEINARRKKQMAERVIAACGGSVRGKTIAMLGLTFKPNTDDMRDAPSLDIIPALQEAGATIRAYDPEGMEEAKPHFENVTFCEGPYEALDGADAIALVTEWDVFRALDLPRVKKLLKSPTMIDMRNVYDPAHMASNGFDYYSIGRAFSAKT